MLWTIFVILLVLWLLGLVSSYTLGGFIHILLVIAIEVEKDAPFRIGFSQRLAERLHVSDRLAIHLSDDVFALNVLSRSDAVVLNIGYDHALLDREMKTFGNIFR